MRNIVNSKHIFIITIISIIFVSNMAFSNNYIVPQIPIKSSYEIQAEINVTEKIIKGEEIIVFTNSADQELETLAFDWSISENSIHEISLNGELLSLLNTIENETAQSPLLYSIQSLVKPGEKVRIKIKFSSNILIKNTDKIELQRWFPRLWWDGIDTFDSFKIKLNVPTEYVVAISGRLNKKTGFYENNGARSCGVCLYKDHLVEQKEVDDILITSIYTEKGTDCAKLCLETAADVIKFYKDWLGFYPFKFLTIVPGMSFPAGGYPFASGIVVIHGQEQFQEKSISHWQWITAHEIGHQYWGEYVFDNNNSWLWIGLGIYADREYSIYSNLGIKKHIGFMNGYINGVRKYYDTTADLTDSQIKKIDFDHNNIIMHDKGLSIISALECTIGKEIFIKIYKRCLDEYTGKYLGYRDFWRICEEESGENLAWFFEQWVRSNKYLSYDIISQNSEQSMDGIETHVVIKCYGTLKMPIPVKVVFEDGSSQVKFTNRLLDINNICFKSTTGFKKAILDPDAKLAMIKDTLFISHEEIVENISKMPWTNVQNHALELFSQAKQSKIQDSWFKLGLVLFDSRNDEKVLYCFERAHEFDPNDFVTIVWLGHMNDLKGNREEAIKYYKSALENDYNSTTEHGQFGLYINKKWIEEKLKTPFTFDQ